MIARKSALIIAFQFIDAILGYVGLKLIAVNLNPVEYGIVGFAYGFVALFTIVNDLGFSSAHIKKVSEGKSLSTCIATFSAIKTFLVGIFAASVILSIAIWKYVFGQGFESPVHEQALYVLLAYFVLNTLTISMFSTFQSKKEIAKSEIPHFLFVLVKVMATIIVIYTGMGVLALAFTYVIAEVFQFSLVFIFFRHYPVGKPSFSYFKEYAIFAFPLAISNVSSVIMTNIDKVFIQLFWSSQQVGEYFAIVNLSNFLILFATAVGTLLFPVISEYYANNNMDAIQQLIQQSERYLSMIVFPLIFLMVILAKPIITILLSDQYLPAIAILQILPFFVLLEVLQRPYVNLVKGINMPKFARNKIIIMMIINVILNILLVPKDIKSLGITCAGLGATGSAIATVIAYIVGLIYIRIVALRVAKIKGSYKPLLHAASATLMVITIYFITQYVLITRWYHLLAISLFGLALYFLILFIIKEFRKDDFDLFIDTLNIKKMLKYIGEELKNKGK